MLGLTVLERPDFGFGGYWLDAGGQQLHLMESESRARGGDHFAIRVDDLESAVADIRAHGVTVNTIDHMAGAGHQAFLHDPSGQLHRAQPARRTPAVNPNRPWRSPRQFER